MANKKVGVRANLSKLKGFINSLGDINGMSIKVGIMHNKDARKDKTSNASIGIVHEFGSFTRNIPERSFLKMPLTTHQKSIITEAKKEIETNLVEGTVRQKLVAIGHAAENIVDQAFDSDGFGSWPSLSPATEKAKNSSAVLIDSGELRRSITSVVGTRGR